RRGRHPDHAVLLWGDRSLSAGAPATIHRDGPRPGSRSEHPGRAPELPAQRRTSTMRRLGRFTAAAAVLALCAAPFGGRAEADQSPDPSAVVFTHGVASGDVTPVSAVLWTRVDREADLTAEVAQDQAFGRAVVRRSARASAGNDFIVTTLV